MGFERALMSMAQIPRTTGGRERSWRGKMSEWEATEEGEEDRVSTVMLAIGEC